LFSLVGGEIILIANSSDLTSGSRRSKSNNGPA
jgi:hypothetical protein